MPNIEDLTLDERETHLNMTDDDHNNWFVFSDDPYWIRRLDKVAECVREEPGGGKHYRLDKGQVTIRKKPKKRKPTPAQLAALEKARSISNPG